MFVPNTGFFWHREVPQAVCILYLTSGNHICQQALVVLHSLHCRSKPLPVATLTQVLEQPALNGGDGGGKFKVVYQRLWTLLHFLVLPSKVSDWLPFEDITVSDSVALEFSYFCLAQEAADLIRTFQPDLAAGGGFAWSNTAAFLVRTNAAKPGLTVQLVKVREPAEFQAALAKTVKWQEVFMQPLMSRTSFGSIRCTASDCSIDLGSTHVLQVPISVKEDGTITEKPTLLPNAWASCGTVVGPHAKADNCIGEFHHPGLGRYLAEALKPACGVNLRIVVCTVKAIAHGSGNTYVTRPIPLWVLHWGPQRLVWNLADALAATFASMWQSIINVIRWVDSCVH